MLKDIVIDIWQKYGPFAALFILGVLYYNHQITSIYTKLIQAKDKEIERLVEQRNKLQDVILKKRITSTEEKK